MKHTVEEARKIWVDALRSGKYKQATSTLKVQKDEAEPGYCCLGVACELYQEHEGGLDVSQYTATDRNTYTTFNNYGSLPPDRVTTWLGITKHGELVKDFTIDEGIVRRALTDLNDGGYTFEQIADIIEGGHLRTVSEP